MDKEQDIDQAPHRVTACEEFVPAHDSCETVGTPAHALDCREINEEHEDCDNRARDWGKPAAGELLPNGHTTEVVFVGHVELVQDVMLHRWGACYLEHV